MEESPKERTPAPDSQVVRRCGMLVATHPQLCGPSHTDTPLPLGPPADQRTRTLSSEVPASSADPSQSSCPPVGSMEIDRPPPRYAPLLPSPCPTLLGPRRQGPVSVCLSILAAYLQQGAQ